MELIYLSGAITGLTHGQATDWRDYAHNRFHDLSGGRVGTLSPMRGKKYLDDGNVIEADVSQRVKALLSMPGTIATRDENDVRRCSGMLVNLLGAPRVSIGTVWEIGIATALRKPMVVVIEETGNLHDHPLVRHPARICTPDLDEGIETLFEIARHDGY